MQFDDASVIFPELGLPAWTGIYLIASNLFSLPAVYFLYATRRFFFAWMVAQAMFVSMGYHACWSYGYCTRLSYVDWRFADHVASHLQIAALYLDFAFYKTYLPDERARSNELADWQIGFDESNLFRNGWAVFVAMAYVSIAAASVVVYRFRLQSLVVVIAFGTAIVFLSALYRTTLRRTDYDAGRIWWPGLVLSKLVGLMAIALYFNSVGNPVSGAAIHGSWHVLGGIGTYLYAAGTAYDKPGWFFPFLFDRKCCCGRRSSPLEAIVSEPKDEKSASNKSFRSFGYPFFFFFFNTFFRDRIDGFSRSSEKTSLKKIFQGGTLPPLQIETSFIVLRTYGGGGGGGGYLGKQKKKGMLSRGRANCLRIIEDVRLPCRTLERIKKFL